MADADVTEALTRFITCRPVIENQALGSVPVKRLLASLRALRVYSELMVSGNVPDMSLPVRASPLTGPLGITLQVSSTF